MLSEQEGPPPPPPPLQLQRRKVKKEEGGGGEEGKTEEQRRRGGGGGPPTMSSGQKVENSRIFPEKNPLNSGLGIYSNLPRQMVVSIGCFQIFRWKMVGNHQTSILKPVCLGLGCLGLRAKCYSAIVRGRNCLAKGKSGISIHPLQIIQQESCKYFT